MRWEAPANRRSVVGQFEKSNLRPGRFSAYGSPVHWQVGEATLTTLSDGYFEVPLEHLIVNASMEEVLKAQHGALRLNPPRIDVNAYLVRSPHHAPLPRLDPAKIRG